MIISTHVLDVMRGWPAAGVAVRLERLDEGEPTLIGRAETDGDGRVANLSTGTRTGPGAYRLTFETGDYFRSSSTESFHPRVLVEFEVRDPGRDYHVPLLLSPFGFTTYRGS